MTDLLRCGRAALLAAFAVAAPVSAQTTRSTIEGRVMDPSGAALPDARIEVRGETLGRTVSSDGVGFFRAPALPAGAYTVAVSAPGFKTCVLEGIELLLDRTLSLTVPLELAVAQEFITLQVEAPLLDFTNSATRQVIDSRAKDAIPLNGRSYLDLVLLTPGVSVNPSAYAELPPARDTRGAILGERAGNATFLIDGIENNDDFRGGVFQVYSQEAIREFEVIPAGYKAEFGGGSGGVVNVISRSGGNAFEGSAYFFLRNDALDASNVSGEPPLQLERYDGGLVVSGPIARDRSWYLASLEYVNERRQALFLPGIPEILRAGEDFSRQPETEDARVFAKYDRRLGARSDLRLAASFNSRESLNERAGPFALPRASRNSGTKTFQGAASFTSVLGARALIESSLVYRAQHFDQSQAATGRSFGVIFLDTGDSFDIGPLPASELNQKYLTLREALTLYSGERHAAKLGAEYTRTRVDGRNDANLFGIIATTAPNFARFGLDSFQIPQGVGFFGPGDDTTRLRNHGLSLFAQDDWRISSRLTANLGLRWDYDSRFGDADNLAPRLGLVERLSERTLVRTSFGLFYDRYRLGIAQTVPELGGIYGRTVVELDYPRLLADVLLPLPGSLAVVGEALQDPFALHRLFGIPLDAVVRRDNIQSLTGMDPAAFLAALDAFLRSLGVPYLPVDFSPSTGYLRQDLAAGFQDAIRASHPFRTPYNATFTAGVQHALLPDLAVSATYVNRSIRNVLGLKLTNLARESREVGQPITTDGGPLLRTYGPFYSGRYDGIILSVEKRFRNSFQIQAHYTYSKATDNLLYANLGLGVAAQGGGAVPTDSLDLELDRGNSDLAVPHVFVLWGLVRLPAGFQMSGVFRATSGVHFSPASTPLDYDGDGIFSTRPLGTTRNQFRGPGTRNLDLRIEKRFRWSKCGVAVLAEAFNLTNARNPSVLETFFSEGRPGPGFGTTRVPLPGREVQLGLRVTF